LPPEVGNLTSLTNLHLDGNELTTLPPEIGRLSNLTYLHLHDNKLTRLPPEIGKLANLAMLELSGNPITDADLKHLISLNNLTYLCIRSTKVTPKGSRGGGMFRLPWNFGGVEALQRALPKCMILFP